MERSLVSSLIQKVLIDRRGTNYAAATQRGPAETRSLLKSRGAILLGALFIVTGSLHFVSRFRGNYLSIMPPQLPFPLQLIYVSGVFEILGGIGLCVPRLRRAAGMGLLLLLVAVFPANIYGAVRCMASRICRF